MGALLDKTFEDILANPSAFATPQPTQPERIAEEEEGGKSTIARLFGPLMWGQNISANIARDIFSSITDKVDPRDGDLLSDADYTDLFNELFPRADIANENWWENLPEELGRATAGLVLNIGLDPLTYLTFGAGKGIAIAGKEIPGMAKMLSAVGTAPIIRRGGVSLKGVGTGLQQTGLGKTLARGFQAFPTFGYTKLSKPVSGAELNISAMMHELQNFGHKSKAQQQELLETAGKLMSSLRKDLSPQQLDEARRALEEPFKGFARRVTTARKIGGEAVEVLKKEVKQTADEALERINLRFNLESPVPTKEEMLRIVPEAELLADTQMQEFVSASRNITDFYYGKRAATAEAAGRELPAYLPGYLPHVYREQSILQALKHPSQWLKMGPGGVTKRVIKQPYEFERKMMNTVDELMEKGMDIFEPDPFVAVIDGAYRNLAQGNVRDLHASMLGRFGEAIDLENLKKGLVGRPDGWDMYVLDRQALSLTKARDIAGSIEKAGKKDILKAIREGKGGFITEHMDVEALEGFVKSKPGNFEVFMVPEPLAVGLERINSAFGASKEINVLARVYDSVLGIWKGYATAANPNFHIRNFADNMFKLYLKDGMYLATHLPQNSLHSVGILAGKEGTIKLARGRTMSYADVRRIANENGILRTTQVQEVLDAANRGLRIGQQDKINIFARLNPGSQENVVLQAGRKFGGIVEDEAKLLGLINDLQRSGGDVAYSVRRTKDFLFDYTELSPFEKAVGRRAIPFYTFMRKNVPLVFREVVRQPGKFAALSKMALFSENLAESREGELPSDIRAGIPQYFEEIQATRTPLTVGDFKNVPFINKLFSEVDEEDTPIYMFNPLSVNDLNFLSTPEGISFMSVMDEMIQRSTPLFNIPVAIYSNRDAFRGQELARTYGDVQLQVRAPNYFTPSVARTIANQIPWIADTMELNIKPDPRSGDPKVFMNAKAKKIAESIIFLNNIGNAMSALGKGQPPTAFTPFQAIRFGTGAPLIPFEARTARRTARRVTLERRQEQRKERGRKFNLQRLQEAR